MLEKLNCYVAKVCIFLVTVALIAGMIGCDYTPPPSQNLEIRTWYDLDAVRDDLGASYILMNDLDSTTAGYEELASPTANGGQGWEPIGQGGWVWTWFGVKLAGEIFRGTLDGQGYAIRDLYINRQEEDQVGLFGIIAAGGIITEGGIIKNVTMINANVTTGEATDEPLGLNEDTVRALDVAPVWGIGGLVGYNGGTVSNCHGTGNVSSDSGMGGLVGNNGGTVSNCSFTGSVSGNEGVGGLVRQNDGTVRNCYFVGNVTGNRDVGGLVGYSSGTVSNSYYNCDEVLINGQNIITIGALFGEDFEEWLANDRFLNIKDRLTQEGGYYLINDVNDFKQLLAFGQDNSLKFRLKNDLDLGDEPNFYIPYLAGEFDGNGHKISNLKFKSDFVSYVGLFGQLASGGKVSELGIDNVNITGAWYVGGLIGSNYYGTVNNCYATGSVAGDVAVGGLVGDNYDATVKNSYSAGSVAGTSFVGGLVGDNDEGTVSDSYSISSVSGNSSVGGLVGGHYDATVKKCYSAGSVAGTSSVGGLVGYNLEGIVSHSFWDTETSGQATSAGGAGKTTAELKNIGTFTGAGWDISAVNPSQTNPAHTWNIVSGVTYPFLSWQP
jgi:hypothetical protein